MYYTYRSQGILSKIIIASIIISFLMLSLFFGFIFFIGLVVLFIINLLIGMFLPKKMKQKKHKASSKGTKIIDVEYTVNNDYEDEIEQKE